MSKLSEQRHTLEATEAVINKMIHEIDLLRNIVARYHHEYGSEIAGGIIDVPDSVSFDILARFGRATLCDRTDHDLTNIESRYQQIKREVKRLV